MRFKQPELRKARIEIVPMIDTIFFLLVFFMVTWVSLVKMDGLGLTIPRENSSRQQTQTATTLSVSPDGRYYINGSLTDSKLWQTQIRSLIISQPDSPIVLNVAPNQSTQTLISLLDALNTVVADTHSQAKIIVATKRAVD